jgi:hypothetical protein
MAKDLCIMCGKESPYDFNTHIDYRVGYVEGAGQLCTDCHQGKSEKITLNLVVTEDMVLNTPNDFDLGEKVRRMYYAARNNS